MKKTISILGSTGSIGKQALEVVDSLNDNFDIFGLAAGDNIESFIHQINKYKPQMVSVKSERAALELMKQVSGVEVLFGDDGLTELAKNKQNDTVLISVAGTAGLLPTLAAIENNIDVALANKETLVTAGDIVMKSAIRNNVNILPVDSEHSAIHQCIKDINQVRKLIVTASGGPFREKNKEYIANATVKETLAHPRWSMGDKITVDSATLMNKGLEVIEAHHLFNVDYNNIEVVVHPQSIVHSAIEYIDGSVIAQVGVPSMHIPIQYALTYPDRVEGLKTDSFSFSRMKTLDFYEPDLDKFPCLKIAFEVGAKGKTYPAVLNAANEEAVYAFLKGDIKLSNIVDIVEKTLENHKSISNPTLLDILEVDKWAREFALSLI